MDLTQRNLEENIVKLLLALLENEGKVLKCRKGFKNAGKVLPQRKSGKGFKIPGKVLE